MKMYLKTTIALIIAFLLFACNNDKVEEITTIIPVIEPVNESIKINYLALGDSYTIGESVCEMCRFPEQLKKGLEEAEAIGVKKEVSLKIIAQTGWTTSNLISAINTANLSTNYDLVTLLIGVNNQYQNKKIAVYETEFPLLLTKAIVAARGDKDRVIVVSIPDYAYTPYGKKMGNQVKISTEIDVYNTFAEQYCKQNNVTFIPITDITRLGITNTDLVANDGLHPSELAYSKFVERILPKAFMVLF